MHTSVSSHIREDAETRILVIRKSNTNDWKPSTNLLPHPSTGQINAVKNGKLNGEPGSSITHVFLRYDC